MYSPFPEGGVTADIFGGKATLPPPYEPDQSGTCKSRAPVGLALPAVGARTVDWRRFCNEAKPLSYVVT